MGRISHRHSRRAFTLMELMTVMVIMSILAVLLLKVTDTMKARAEKASCISNLKNLYAGAGSYVLDHQQWPQISPTLVQSDATEYAKLWINALAPYGLSQRNWVCPTAQRSLNGPDLTNEKNRRVDYNATPFDAKPNTPYMWPRQPWFVEHTSSHDGGPLLILTNGKILTLEEATGMKF